MSIKNLLTHITQKQITIKEAYDAGYDCGKNGTTEANCDFRYFATPELTAAWGNGKLNGEADKSR